MSLAVNRAVIRAAYEGIERLSEFSPETLAHHRTERLKKYDDFVRLVRRHVGRTHLRIVDIGSGSSALAYRLEASGMLARADCVELSSTRHAFAERWRRDGGFRNIRNHKREAAAFDFEGGERDAIVCIDNTFPLLASCYAAAAQRRLLDQWYAALRPAGAVLLHLSLSPSIVGQLRSGVRAVQLFEESHAGRFRFRLYEYRLKNRRLIEMRSIYVEHGGRVREKTELNVIFTVPELVAMFTARGFRVEATYGDARMKAYRETDDAVMLVFRK